MKRITSSVRIGAALVLAPAVLVLASGPALAADSVLISNTETVQAHLNADGTVQDARIYEQIALQGNGTVTFKNPVSTKNLRNLDGFGSFEVKDGNIVSTATVNGEQRLRAVSDFGKVLPLKVAVTYKLDGKTVDARDVVGKSGRLEVHYTVTNVTGKDQQVTYDDGTGKKVTETQNVVIPMIGSLTTVLPSGFTNVQSGEASIAGDGRGATQVSFNMTLFGPIGSSISEFGYSATIKDGMVPDAVIAALPVSPLDSPSFKGGAASYKAGADSGVTLTAGAMKIDANLLKLRDGAATLIAGLIQLRDGAQKLNAGLAGEAAPGALALADGASQLKSGAGQLAAGADAAKAGSGQVATGSTQLAAGASKLDAGAGQLSDGLNQASAGAPALLDGLAQVYGGLELVDGSLAQLYDGIGGLPAKAQPLHDGIKALLAGIGSASDPADTLAYGVKTIQEGLAAATAPGGSLDLLKGGVDAVKTGLGDAVTGLGEPTVSGLTARYGVDQVKKGLDAGLAPYPDGGIAKLVAGVTAAKAGCDPLTTCVAYLDGVLAGLGDLKTQTEGGSVALGKVADGLTLIANGLTGQAIPGLGQVSAGLAELKTKLAAAAAGLVRIECGLDNTAPIGCTTAPGLVQGLALVDGGVSQLVSGVVSQVQGAVGQATDVAPTQNTLRGGVHAVMGGIDLIGEGGLTLLDGLDQLSAGAGDLKAGTGELSTGANKLATGAGQLDSGLGQLSSGAGLLGNGTDQLFAGANKLAAGLGVAATGSGQIADGLAKAAADGKAIPDGAAQLSAEGTSKLVEAGKTTASDYGLKYAVIVAGAERAKTEGMAYGAPDGAAGATAYSLEISGANSDGGTDVGRGVGALVLFGAGGGLLFFRRRFI